MYWYVSRMILLMSGATPWKSAKHKLESNKDRLIQTLLAKSFVKKIICSNQYHESDLHEVYARRLLRNVSINFVGRKKRLYSLQYLINLTAISNEM